MIPSFLSFLGLIHIDRQIKLLQYKSHVLYAGNNFDLEGFFRRFSFISSSVEGSYLFSLVSEYFATYLQTIIIGLLLYFPLTISSYLYFFIYKKSK